MNQVATSSRDADMVVAPRPRFDWRTSRIPGFTLVVLLLLLWEASARFGWISGNAWPPMSVILSAGVQGIFNGELLGIFGPSVGRMLLGFVIGCGLGFVVGVLAGAFAPLHWATGPWLEIIRILPTPAIIPTMILFLGVDDPLKITVVALGTFFPVYINTISAFHSTSKVLLDTARTLRLSRARTLFAIVLPSILPAVASGVRISIGFALVITVIAEMISGSSGIGFYIMQTQYTLNPEKMYTAVIGLGIVGYTMNAIFQQLERKFIGWYGKS